MEIIFLIIGLLLGFVFAWLIIKIKFSKKKRVSLEEADDLKKRIETFIIENKVAEERLNNQSEEISKINSKLEKERENNLQLNKIVSAKEANYKNLEDKLKTQKEEIENIQQKFSIEFKNLANEILEEKTKKFTEQNRSNLDEILKPLNEKIKDFEKKVEDTYEKGLKDQTDLKAELKKLHDLNYKISEEASNLTRALKGDVKKQGSWGEIILEKILENSGLRKDVEYKIQYSTTNDEGKRIQPDVVIYLPENKHIIIDSKVSLIAYEHYVNCTNEEDKSKFIKEHLISLKNHIKHLSEKNYYTSPELNSPDYVLMFVPIEASFSIAITEDRDMFNFAWNHKIVIVSPSTLIATLMTVSSIWKQENQTKNAIEIAKKSGDLLDKFYGLVNDLLDVGNKLKSTQKSYESSMNKLSEGKGNLIRKTIEIKELGVKTKKTLPEKIVERAENKELPE
ncbi:MAG: DNA recombination protein RmuC [Bacteroidales bacterium]|nr:DNA recombination protein RmuC [Bacteroidales bacterium]